MNLEGVTACAVARRVPMSAHFDVDAYPREHACTCAGTKEARKLAELSTYLRNLSETGQASVVSRGFRCLVIWNPIATVAVTIPSGHRVAKSLNRMLRRLIIKHFPATPQISETR